MPATPQKFGITPEEVARIEADVTAWKEQNPGKPYPGPRWALEHSAVPIFEDTKTFLKAYSTGDLARLPEPEWLIENMVEKGGITALTGEYGTGKTYLTIDLALRLATGYRQWNGYEMPAEPHKVLYVLAEGWAWLYRRIRAWEKYNDTPVTENENIIWVPESVNIYPGSKRFDPATPTGDIMRLVNTVEAFRPHLVVFDTFTRVTPGMNENQREEVDKVIQVADHLREEYGCSVMFLHHPNKAGDTSRGSNSLPGAIDVGVGLSRPKKRESEIVLDWWKHKNFDPPAPVSMVFQEVEPAALLVPYLSPPSPSGKKRSSKFYEFKKAWDGGELEGMSYQEMVEYMNNHYAVSISPGSITNWMPDLTQDEPEEL